MGALHTHTPSHIYPLYTQALSTQEVNFLVDIFTMMQAMSFFLLKNTFLMELWLCFFSSPSTSFLLLLLFYPMKWFQKCLNCLRLSHVALHTFVDSFAGCYKDGTEPGTRDCRYFAALYLLVLLPQLHQTCFLRCL